MKLLVKGMHCPSCKMLIEEELSDNGATDIRIDIDTEKQEGSITLTTDKAFDEIKAIIEGEGDYTVTQG